MMFAQSQAPIHCEHRRSCMTFGESSWMHRQACAAKFSFASRLMKARKISSKCKSCPRSAQAVQEFAKARVWLGEPVGGGNQGTRKTRPGQGRTIARNPTRSLDGVPTLSNRASRCFQHLHNNSPAMIPPILRGPNPSLRTVTATSMITLPLHGGGRGWKEKPRAT